MPMGKIRYALCRELLWGVPIRPHLVRDDLGKPARSGSTIALIYQSAVVLRPQSRCGGGAPSLISFGVDYIEL